MSHRLHAILLATSALVPLSAHVALANPLGAQVVGGSATIAGQGTANVTVTQSSLSAIINWQTFNIGVGEMTRFVQPSAKSVVLDRVTGGLGPSTLYGTLKSNGEVFLVNPDGVLIGPTGKIQTGAFLAATHDISNADFMSGKYRFSLSGRADASIVNEGSITAQSGGFAALVAPGVRNTGTITATLGTVALASGNAFSLDFYGDQLIKLGVSDSIAAQVIDVSTGKPLASLVSNEGAIKANGGRVELSAVAARAVVDSVINNAGVIEANTIGKHNGMIMLGAATGASKPVGAPTQVVKVSGKLSAAGKEKETTGGAIVVTGESIQIANAQIDASGQAGGGKVLIGGDTGGGNPSPAVAGISEAALEAFAVPDASNVSVDAATTISASALNTGNGGKVVVWADETTRVAGSIAARGGALLGDGGFVETSGHDELAFTGSVNVGAANGVSGTWLLDPTDVTIASTGAWVVTPTAIENALASGNVVVTTPTSGTDAGDITVAEPISWSSPNFLTLSAFRNIAVNANITNTDGAAVNLRADNTGTGVGTVSFGSGAKISTSGVVSIFYNPSVNPAGSVVNVSSYVSPIENFSGDVAGGAQLTTYMLVNNIYDLQNIENNLSGNYALGTNIDASATAAWNGGAGFVPIAILPQAEFTGNFDGNGHVIDGLTIKVNVWGSVGLFSFSAGTIQNLTLADAQISCSGGPCNVGGLVGTNAGTITNAAVTGSVSGYNADVDVGGVVGANAGTIQNCSANGSVGLYSTFGGSGAGGLVGWNGGLIRTSYSTSNVSANSTSDTPTLGGLVGQNAYNGPGLLGVIQNSYATGSVSGTNNSYVGGLVGINDINTRIQYSYATGFLSSGSNSQIGGLVGVNSNPTTSSSYWDTQSTGQPTSGGGTGLTTTQMKLGIPSGFDPTVWGINASINNGYPYLLWQTAAASPPKTTTLTGGPSEIEIVVEADPETKIYGIVDPTLAYQIVSGTLTGGATFSGSLTRDPGENVGTYTISEGTLSLPSSYALVFEPSSFKITPAPLTITANNAILMAGQPNPSFTASYSGFVLGDKSNVVSGLTFSPASTVNLPAGTYAIVPGGAVAANYSISYVNGKLTVVSQPATTNTQIASLTLQTNDQLQQSATAISPQWMQTALLSSSEQQAMGDTPSCVDFVKASMSNINWPRVGTAGHMLTMAKNGELPGLDFYSILQSGGIQKGDILIFSVNSSYPDGHVAIVAQVTGSDVTVNQRDFPQGGPYQDVGHFNVNDPSIAGVIRVAPQ